MVKTKEERSQYMKEYREKNKKNNKKYMKDYYQKNKQKHKEYNQIPKRKMNIKITRWKRIGLKCDSKDDYELIYFTWLNNERCEECNIEYTKENKKCMDHCHDTGLFRNILCNSCNTKRRAKKNYSGITNIHKNNTGWMYKIDIKGKIHRKFSNDLEFLKEYKIKFEKENLYNL